MAENRSELLVVVAVFLVAVSGLALMIARSSSPAPLLPAEVLPVDESAENVAGEAWRNPALGCSDGDSEYGENDIYHAEIVKGYDPSVGRQVVRSDFCDPTGIKGKLHEFSCTTTATDKRISERIVTCQTACSSGLCLRGRARA